ncbi:hypothetical protein ACHAAC_10725 [Aeromicrobium sp. CF4.19]|uniref:hypothetical protein n=1 Tax=Aeromicrobium sp. CF4.19 TaxID=3373082 RepID=UPI003EE6A736
MNITSTRARRGTAVAFGSVAASAALVLAGMTSASAEDVQLGPNEIAGFQNGDEDDTDGYNYDQWHIGSVANTDLTSEDSLAFNECSVEFLTPPENSESSATDTQVLKGFSVGERPDTIEEIREVFETLAVDMESGEVTLQVPMFIYADEDDDSPAFSTVRNEDAFTTDETHLLPGQALTSTGTSLGDFENPEALLEELAERIEEGERFEVLGVGVTSEPDSVVNSLSALGDTAYFGTGDCLPETPDEDDDADEDADDADDADADEPQAPTRPVAVETGR